MEKKEIVEKKDPDWMYKSILNGAFSGRRKEEEDSIGHSDGGDF